MSPVAAVDEYRQKNRRSRFCNLSLFVDLCCLYIFLIKTLNLYKNLYLLNLSLYHQTNTEYKMLHFFKEKFLRCVLTLCCTYYFITLKAGIKSSNKKMLAQTNKLQNFAAEIQSQAVPTSEGY